MATFKAILLSISCLLFKSVRVVGEGTAKILWKENEKEAMKSLRHDWVLALAGGVLEREDFATYIAQDATFLLSFAKAYGRGLGKCPDELGVECIQKFQDLLAAVTEELQMHKSYAATWGVDLSAYQPLPATTAYTNFLYAVSANNESSAAQVVAAMLPCMALYCFIGQSLNRTVPTDHTHPYRDWIHTYASADFAKANDEVDELLDFLLVDEADGQALDALRPLYQEAMQLEYNFFDAQTWSHKSPENLQKISALRSLIDQSLISKENFLKVKDNVNGNKEEEEEEEGNDSCPPSAAS